MPLLSRLLLVLLLGCALTITRADEPVPIPSPFEAALPLLLDSKFPVKEQAIEQLAQTGDPRLEELFSALLAGDLYQLKSNASLVMATGQDADLRVMAVPGGEPIAGISAADLKKITLNNRMRGQLKAALARLDLSHADPGRRLTAATSLLNDPGGASRQVLTERLSQETDAKVKETTALVLALMDLQSPDPRARLAALPPLRDSLHPQVRAALTQLLERESDGQVKAAASRVLRHIEGRVHWYGQIETLFFGLSLGSVLVLAAIGLAITFGVMGVINMAHGELMMLGAYTTYVMQQLLPDHIGLSLFLAIPAAFVIAGLVGILIERGVIRFLYGRPLETLLATFGISLILQQLVRSIFSPLNRAVETPAWMAGSWQVNEVLSLTLNRLVILGFCLLVFALLYLILNRTRLGLQVRAVSQNRAMARAMGVRSQWVDAMTFGLGAGIAGVAGVALSQLTNVGPNLGQSYIIDSFMVVVFGGVGNLWGTLVAGLGLGVANKLLEPWAGAVLAKILVLVFIILFIQKRPKGLFPQKGRAAT
ncbi:MAG: urea ABC transporter permease subunit UrtB [Gammaproteobacteria bacterium]|nr:MAG: urea ABC transporter permease subunit UrtB [Gammaproteobacteria bacterium]